MEKTKSEKYKVVLKYILFLLIFLILGVGQINFSISPFLVAFLFSLVWCKQNVYICSLFYLMVSFIINPFSLALVISSLVTVLTLIFFYSLHKKLKKPINRYIYILYAFLLMLFLHQYVFQI